MCFLSAGIFFFFLLQNYLLNIYYVPGSVLGFGDEKLNVMKNCTITSPWSTSDFSSMCGGQSLASLGLPQTASVFPMALTVGFSVLFFFSNVVGGSLSP